MYIKKDFRYLKQDKKEEENGSWGMKMRLSIEDFFKSKIANRAIALYYELGKKKIICKTKIIGPYAVYLHFIDIFSRLDMLGETWGLSTGNLVKFRKIKQVILAFIEEIQAFNNKLNLSEKCQRLIKNLDYLYQNDAENKGIIFVERKYIARVLNKIINQSSKNFHLFFNKFS